MSRYQPRRIYLDAPPYDPNGFVYDIHGLDLATWLLAGCGLELARSLTWDGLRDLFAGELTADLETVISRSTQAQFDNAMAIIASREFRNWIEIPFSGIFEYNDDELHQFNTPTTSSIISREVICSSQPDDGRVVLGFFGGLRYPERFLMIAQREYHRGIGPPVRPFQNGEGLLRHLLLQLLLSMQLETVSLPWTREVLAAGLTQDPGRTFELLYQLFDRLMFQSPAREIIIVIDNIRNIDGAGPDLVNKLLYKVRAARNSQNSPVVLKLLMTNQARALRLETAATMQAMATVL